MAALLVGVSAAAAPIDDAKKLYNNGEYEQAAEALRKIVKKTPKDGTANYYLGAALYALGDYAEARGPLTVAEGSNVADASRLLAIIALDGYDANTASAHITTWEKALTKAKKAIPQELTEMQRRSMQMRNMLGNVEKIEILDSISVDSAEFFNAYRLSAAAGRVLPPEAVRRIGAGTPGRDLSVAYMPQNNSEILWAETDDEGTYILYGADILDDGTVDHPAPLDEDLGEGGNAKFPFLMPDGVTLYFANDGENSLGGYDIFMTRRSDDGSYFQPQNMGMPYNSPFNDYMLAIDETSGLGWWATDRNAEPGQITIYIFSPSQMRVNVSPADENLAHYAKLDNLSLIRDADQDYKAILAERLPAEEEGTAKVARNRFVLDMGNGRIYTSVSDFRNSAARSAMLEAIATEIELNKHLAAEEALRDKYRKGDLRVASDIIASEKHTDKLRRQLATQRNKAIRLETK